VSLVLEIDGSQLTFDEKDGAFVDALDVGLIVPDAEGKLVASNRETVNLRLDAATHASVAKDGVRYVTACALPPGRYHLRVAAAERDRALAGSIGYDLDVPAPSSAIAMGQLVVTSSGAGAMHTVGDWKEFKGLLPGPPAATRRFAATDVVAVLAHVRAQPSIRATAIDCSAFITSESGQQVFSRHDERAVADVAQPDGWDYELRLVPGDLPAGHYALTVMIQARGGSDRAARTIPFDIAPAGRTH